MLVKTDSCWKELRLTGQFCHTVYSHLTSFNMAPICFGVLSGRPLSNAVHVISDARQAMSKAKSGPVETGLTRLAAIALHKYTSYRWKVIQLSSKTVYGAML